MLSNKKARETKGGVAPPPPLGLPPEGGARTYLCPAGLIYGRLDLFMPGWTYLCPAGAKLDHDLDYKR